jgi:AcrR family transcriptional regulator
MTERMIYQTEETRGKILQVAEGLFLERGFFETQMKDVAAAVGMSRNTLYRYFRDKRDLGFAIVEIGLNKLALGLERAVLRERDAGHPHARALLMATLADVFGGAEYETQLCFMAEFDAYFSGRRIPEDFADRLGVSWWAPIWATLESIVQEGVTDGSIRSDTSPRLLLATTLTAIKVMRQQIVSRGSALSDSPAGELEQLVPTLLELLSAGLAPQARAG